MKKFILLNLLSTIFLLLFCNIIFASEYSEHTKTAIDKIIALTNELNSFTDDIIKNGKATIEQKNIYDKKIKDFKEYLNNDPYIIHKSITTVSGGPVDSFFMNYKGEKIPKGLEETNKTLDYYEEDYNKAFRRYAINILLYTNGYRSLPAYLDNYTKLPDDNIYFLDDMKVVKIDNYCVEIDLTNAQYTILPESDDTYGYASIKIVSPKGNTYFFTGYSNYSNMGNFDGYFLPTEKGLRLECDWNERKMFYLNTENKPELVENEAIMLRDVFFNKYLKQNKINWTYKKIKFSGDGKGNYYISIPKKANSSVEYSNDSETMYLLDDKGSYNGIESGNSRIYMSVDNGKYKYFWRITYEEIIHNPVYINHKYEILSHQNEGDDKYTITYEDKVIHLDTYVVK